MLSVIMLSVVAPTKNSEWIYSNNVTYEFQCLIELHFNGRLQTLPANIRPRWKRPVLLNTLAYYPLVGITQYKVGPVCEHNVVYKISWSQEKYRNISLSNGTT